MTAHKGEATEELVPVSNPEQDGPGLDALDRELINRLQTDFPLDVRPYETIGRMLGITEEEVLARLERMQRSGVIRRIGANVSPGKMGYTSTLCAAKVPNDRIDEFARVINEHPGVTHNYQRDHEYNVWFTIIAPSLADVESFLEEVKRKTGVATILNMPAVKIFKLRAEFIL